MDTNYIIEILLTVGIGILIFFLRRTSEELERCKRDILRVREDYITKEDFFREQNENRRKLDRIMNILLDMKGEIGYGQADYEADFCPKFRRKQRLGAEDD